MVNSEQLEAIKFKMTIAIEYKKMYKNPDLSLTKFAAALDVSYGLLSEIIRDEYGMGFRMYLNDIRIRKVLEEIDRYGTSLKVNDYAKLVGFQSRVTFFNAFKSRMGISLMKYLLEKNGNEIITSVELNSKDNLGKEDSI